MISNSSGVRRTVAALAMTAALAVTLVGCSSSGGTTTSGKAPGGTYTFWDPYPQWDETTAWGKLVDQCGTQAGVTVKRTSFDTSTLTSKALLAGQQKNSPDVLLVDNPVVSTLADAGLLTTTEENKLDTSEIQPNLIGAGLIDGKTYGVPVGANTLALYYNKKVLSAAGVDPASVTDWTSLTAALAKVKKAGYTGITFSGINTEEGSFQFLPWFWGAGADLTKLDSSQGVAALSLVSGWVKDGYAPNSVINDSQQDAFQQFTGGKVGFAENGTWQLGAAQQAGIDYGIMRIPGQTGQAAPVPTGGEFLTIPVQKDAARYQVSEKIVACLSSTDNQVATDDTLNYVAPTAAGQKAQVAKTPSFQFWVDAVSSGKARTGDNLGTKYPKISEQLWTAVQTGLSGAKSPQDALTAAQNAVAAG